MRCLRTTVLKWAVGPQLPTLKNVFAAITIRAQQLTHTLALGVYAVYLFGVIAFLFMPGTPKHFQMRLRLRAVAVGV